jgi:peptidoglycan/LPS O-acetylase OafA/YrhL
MSVAALDPSTTPAGEPDPGPDPGAGGAGSGSTSGFRPDIDALRAVAILAVVLYHAHVPWMAGGFVGVDVFFVISGFLITRNLLREHEGSGRIALGSFWARRIRRLVPAMAVMIVATAVVGVLVLIPLELADLAAQSRAAALYISNLWFAGLSDDYFGSGVEAAPLLHTWSLAVEEQFYVVWPLLVAGASAVAVRRRRPGVALAVVLGGLSLASFALAVRLVDVGSTHAFYGLPARSWEFAVGGLLALVSTRRALRLSASASWTMAVAGLAVIVVTAVTYGPETTFPGIAALPPVIGTLLVLVAGTGSTATWALATGPVRWLGRTSYSWYLWHWPAMVLGVAFLERDTPGTRVALGAAALGLAAASYRFVEDPVRHHPRLVRSGWATAGLALGATAIALGAAAGVDQYREHVQSGSFHEAIAAASSKDYLATCTWSTTDEGDEVCTVGDPEGSRTVVLMGDSHAMSWTPAFDLAGQELGIRVLVRAGNSCPGVPVRTMSEHTGKVNQSCVDYRDATLRMVREERPELVVLVSSDFTRRLADQDGNRIEDREEQLATWAATLEGLRDDLDEQGIALGAVLDNPRIASDPLVCMEREEDLQACEADRADALRRVRLHVANELEVLGPDATMDTIGPLCDEQRCRIWVDGVYAYADATHLSIPYTTRHADDVVEFLQRFPAVS